MRLKVKSFRVFGDTPKLKKLTMEVCLCMAVDPNHCFEDHMCSMNKSVWSTIFIFKVVLRFKIVKIYSNFISRYFANFERLGWDFALRDIFMKKKVILSTITLSGLQVLPKYSLSGSWNSQSYWHNLRLKVGFFFNFWELSVGPQRTIKIRVTLFSQGVTRPRQN